MQRKDKRTFDQVREIRITRDFTKYAEGSVLFEMGDTKVICNATVNEGVPPHKKGTGEGWVTAEYAMLPRATAVRNNRDIANLKLSGRSAEIQRLIGRSLREIVDLSKLGERTVVLDCDVIQADGGTRTAAICGAYVALHIALEKLLQEKRIAENPIKGQIAAVSVGVVDGVPCVDLCFEEDSRAEVDMNIVLDRDGNFIEIQGTGEKKAFSQQELLSMLELAKKAGDALFAAQDEVLQC